MGVSCLVFVDDALTIRRTLVLEHAPAFLKTISVRRCAYQSFILQRHMDHSYQQAIAPVIGGDILRGAGEIAAFLYGNEVHRRKVYNLVETKRLPHFRLGSLVCARKSVLLAWVKAQEDLSNTHVTA